MKAVPGSKTHRACFLRHALYDDGMFWYELFLSISASALSYGRVRGESPDPRQLETLLVTLVLISRYTTAQPGDITRRNQEALGNTLLMKPGNVLADHAWKKAAALDEPLVVQFVEDRIALVERTRRPRASDSDPGQGNGSS